MDAYGCPADCLRTDLRGVDGVEVPAEFHRELIISPLSRQWPRSCSPFAMARLLANQTRSGAGTKKSRSHRAKTAASPAVTSVRAM